MSIEIFTPARKNGKVPTRVVTMYDELTSDEFSMLSRVFSVNGHTRTYLKLISYRSYNRNVWALFDCPNVNGAKENIKNLVESDEIHVLVGPCSDPSEYIPDQVRLVFHDFDDHVIYDDNLVRNTFLELSNVEDKILRNFYVLFSCSMEER